MNAPAYYLTQGTHRIHERAKLTRSAPTQCTVCKHDRRHQIEVALTHGMSRRVIARRFGVGEFAIGRHARNHLSAAMRAAILTAERPSAVDLEQLQRTEAEGLLSQLVVQRARLQQHT